MAIPLPPEVQLMILAHVDQVDIKNWRLVCRSSNYAAIPLLFRTVLMFPSLRSVGHAKSIAGAKHIAPYVLSLEYVALPLPRRYLGLDSFRRELEPTSGRPQFGCRPKASLNVLAKHKQCLKELASQAKYNHCHEIEAVVLLGSSFCNLQKIVVRQHYTSDLDSNSVMRPETLRLRRGSSFDWTCGSGDWNHFHDLFMACADRHLQEIVSDHLVWTSLLSINSVFEAYPDYGQSVRRLELHASAYDYQNILDVPGMRRVHAEQFASFVQRFCNLEDLTLNMGANPGLCAPRELQLITNALIDKFWPLLRSLKLTAIASAEDSFVPFLARHDKTLRSLSLTHVRLCARSGDSVSSFLHKIREALHLEQAQLRGSWICAGFEAWDAKPRAPLVDQMVDQLEQDVLSDIQLFLCRQAPYPIPPDAIQHLSDATIREDHNSVLSSEYANAKCSFQWCYSLMRSSLGDQNYGILHHGYGDGYDDGYYEEDYGRYQEETSISPHYGFVYDERGFFGDSDEYSLYEDYSDSFDSWGSFFEDEDVDEDDSSRSDKSSDRDEH